MNVDRDISILFFDNDDVRTIHNSNQNCTFWIFFKSMSAVQMQAKE